MFEIVVKFLYFGDIEVEPDLAIDLFFAADEYCLEELKQKCEKLIVETITVENVGGLLSSAVQYHALYLKTCCISFMLLHRDGWEKGNTLDTLTPEAAKELLKFE
eukprot:TRINITY_DN8213_c0_g1_i2.p1 TRINITY_DN8213_c0_g1~~TRINITY_DN8213_c0_g1_i2.p1  ORF type:complete len:105 (-),score=28.28 TRINITY_DN8213_c0_g1_i2:61-375(-)